MKPTTSIILILTVALLLSACGISGRADSAPSDGRPKPVPSLLRKMVPTSSWMPAGWSFRQIMASDLVDVSTEITEDICGITEFGENVKIINSASGYYVDGDRRTIMVMLAIHTDNGPAVVDTFTTGATCDEWQLNGLTMRFSAAPDRNLGDGGWMRTIDAYGDELLLKGRVAILHVGDVVVRSVIFRNWALPDETLALWHSMLDHAINVATTGEPLPAPTAQP